MRSTIGAIGVGVAVPAVATAAAVLIGFEGPITATALAMLAVVGAAIVAGRLGGVVAAVTAMLGLNFFWTHPRHTLRVAASQDVVSLAVFIGIALLVAELVARIGFERARVAEQERGRAELGGVAHRLELERVRLDEEARQAREHAERERLRSALFSSVSHDLRTPLASITAGVTSLAELDDDPAARGEILALVLAEADRMSRLVDNILALAKARAGTFATQRELVPVEDLVEPVVRRLGGRTTELGLVVRMRDDLPAIWVDPLLVDQALTNVVENALGHAPAGTPVTITVAPWQGGAQIRVIDRGPGIPPADRERVFEPFVRGDDRSRPGAGLGLAISKAVAVAHGGRIAIEGSPGGGCTVVLELPQGSETST